MNKIIFFEQNGKICFTIPANPILEQQVRESIKKQNAPAKNAHFFKRGIEDAVNAIVNNQPRQYGTPMVECEDPFTGEKQIMTCQDARAMLDCGVMAYIRHVGGSPLPKDYFAEYKTGQ